jgi:hypothetical protein
MLPGCNRILWISLAAGLLAGAEVYKWVDENGVVHYTETPPEGQQTTPIEVAPPAASAPTPEANAPEAATDTNWYEQWATEQRERKALERRRKEEKTAVRRDEQTHMLEQCAQARGRLEVLEIQCPVFFDGQGILHTACPNQPYWGWGFEGEWRYISDGERASMIAHYQEQLEACEEQGY